MLLVIELLVELRNSKLLYSLPIYWTVQNYNRAIERGYCKRFCIYSVEPKYLAVNDHLSDGFWPRLNSYLKKYAL